MSWFEYGNLEGKDRRLRKGVWLRVRSLPASLLKEAKKSLRTKADVIDWVVVQEMRPNKQVLLEFWTHTLVLDHLPNKPWRYTVFHLLVDEDPKWICEGDLGRGYKEPKEKG
jgi:hypothetical protein